MWLRFLGALTRLYPLRRGRSRLANLLPVGSVSSQRVRFEGRTLEVVLSQHSSRLIALFGSSEPKEQALTKRLVSEGMVALDVGANIGEYVLILAARVGGSGRVYAFEPDPRNCEILERNVRRSGMAGRIHVERAALSDSCGMTTLHLDRDGARNTIAPGARLPEPRGSISVPCLTIDRFAEQQSLGRLDFLKIDAEGAELAILRGGRRALAERRPAVLAEVRQDLGARFGVLNAEVFAFMRSLGYSPRTASGRAPAGGREPAGNIFFIPDSATSFPTPR